MSGQIGSPASWGASDRGRQIRLSAQAVLAASGLPCGLRIYDTPLDPLDLPDLPAIALYSAERRESFSEAGGGPVLRVRYTLKVQYLAVAARTEDVVAQTEAAKIAILDALLYDPVFAAMMLPIGDIETKQGWSSSAERLVGSIEVEIQTNWRESYSPPALTSPLSIDGATTGNPYATRQVVAPLTALPFAVLASPNAQIAANAGNAGNGSLAAAAQGAVQAGSYVVAMTSATGFTLTSPSSAPLGAGTLGVPLITPEITITITAGSVAFAAGDGFRAAFNLLLASETLAG